MAAPGQTEPPVRRSRTRKYAFDYAFTLVGQVTFLLRPLVLIPILMGCYGKVGYGIWTQVLATATLTGAVLSFMVPSAYSRFLSGEKDDALLSARYSGVGLMVLVTAAVTGLGAIAAGGPVAGVVFGEASYRTYLLPLVAYCGAGVFFLTFNNYFLVVERQRTHVAFQVARSLGEISIALLVAPRAPVDVVVWTAAGWIALLATGIAARIFVVHGLRRPALPRDLGFWAFAGALVIAHIAFFGSTQATRFVLLAIADVKVLAVFAAVYSLSRLANLANSANQTALLPAICACWNEGRPRDAEPLMALAYKVLFLVGLPIAGGLYALGPVLLDVLARDQVDVPRTTIALMALPHITAGVFTLGAYAVWMQKKLRWQILIQTFGAVVNIALAVALIGRLGVLGAVLSMVISSLLSAAWMHRFSVAVFNARIDWGYGLRALLCAVLMVAALALWEKAGLERWWLLLTGVPIGAAVYLTAAATVGLLPREVTEPFLKRLRPTKGD